MMGSSVMGPICPDQIFLLPRQALCSIVRIPRRKARSVRMRTPHQVPNDMTC